MDAATQGTAAPSKAAKQLAKRNELREKLSAMSPYGQWLQKEGVPTMGGLMIRDIRDDLPMAMWERKGVKGAFINLQGGEGSMDSYILDIPPAGNTKPEKYMLEEQITVLSGRGATSVWLEGGSKADLRVAGRQHLFAADEFVAPALQWHRR